MHILHRPSLHRLAMGIGLVACIVMTGQAEAVGANNVTRSITVSGRLESGELISLDGSNGTPANLATANRLVGVTGGAGLIGFGEATATTVNVVTSGTTTALVSDINGQIESGDHITASPISGVGMRATESGRVVGIALQNASEVRQQAQSVTNKDGKTVQVHVGLLKTQIQPADYAAKENSTSRIIPAKLQNSLNIATGKEVSAFQVILALVVILVGFVVGAILIAASVRASLTAIGRNPLAAKSVRKGLAQVITTGLIVILAAIVGAYLLMLV